MVASTRSIDGTAPALCGGALLVLAAAAGCADAGREPPSAKPPPIADAGSAGVRSLYALDKAPLAYGSVPWPDDAYLDDQGRVSTVAVPTLADRAYREQLASALHDLDGFGVRPVVYLRFDGALDPATLPADPDASLKENASVFLLDADTSSPNAFERIPIDVRYAADAFELRLRPAYGRALVPGRRYAAVVTNRVNDADGEPVGTAAGFAAIRDQATLDNAVERAARGRCNPVLETLASEGVARERVVSMAVFHVQNVRGDLDEARALLEKRPLMLSTLSVTAAGPDLDTLLNVPPSGALGLDDGAPHDHVGFLARGSVTVPNFLAADPAEHGSFGRGQAGQLLIRGEQDVFFSLWLPRGVSAGASLPVVVIAHDLARERSDAAALADALAGAGFAVFAADAPFHGLRSGSADMSSRFTGEMRSDGFGDAPGDFIGARDNQGELTALHPFYYRDAMRQAAVDTMALFKVIREGDFSELAKSSPGLARVTFDGAHIGYVGVGLGADVGALVAPFEPNVVGFVLAFGGDAGVDGWLASPARASLASALLRRLGHADAADAPEDADDPRALWADVDVFRTLTDRASPFAYAGLLRRSQANALLLLARDDEVVGNQSTEALAYALGAVMVGGEPRHELALSTAELQPGGTLSANFPVEGGDVTRALFVADPATHNALQLEHDTQRYQHPLSEPRVPLEQEAPVANPIATLAVQIGFWFGSVRACMPGNGKVPCAASLQAPLMP